MTLGPNKRAPSLTLIQGTSEPADGGGPGCEPAPRDLDWSILMAHAQAGDSNAYRRLLNEISPYLRSLAARRHRSPNDVEDAVQDILLTVHAIRHTYDPTRPFGPWLTAIANRRLIDRLRRQGRQTSREVPLAAEHETFPADQANLDGEIAGRYDVRTAVENLPASQRQAIQSLKLQEMSLKEAAAATGMSVTALKVATHRALGNLRKMLSTRSEDQ